MPREVIIGHDGEPFAVKVGWAADRDVQIGVETDDGRSIAWVLWQSQAAELGRLVREPSWIQQQVDVAREQALDVDGANRLVGEQILNWLDGLGGVPREGDSQSIYTGVWSTLDRASCNRLIKLLRKARDAAYGADA